MAVPENLRRMAASLAAGSPTCIQKPSITAPCSRPSAESCFQIGTMEKAPLGRPSRI